MKQFDSSITVALEATIWQKGQQRWNPSLTEQQVAIRIIREGKAPTQGRACGSRPRWDDEDVEVEVVKPGKLASWKRNAKWRQWWRGKAMQGFA
jgi:hypothetical protein